MKIEYRKYWLYRKLWESLDIIFPPTCAGCGKHNTIWCEQCENELFVLSGNICRICGNLLNYQGICNQCKKDHPAYEALRSWAAYRGPLKKAIHRLKYSQDISLAERMSRYLIQLFKNQSWEVDIVLPVPLSIAQMKKRGYNQSALLAKPIALAENMIYQPDALVRVRDTYSQTKLSLKERWENVQDAFQAKENLVLGKNILLIDDVATSGATIQSCSAALVSAGAKKVFCLTLAKAVAREFGGEYDT